MASVINANRLFPHPSPIFAYILLPASGIVAPIRLLKIVLAANALAEYIS
jgi:hypothetical protein